MRIGQAAIVVLTSLSCAAALAQEAPRLSVPFSGTRPTPRILDPVPVTRARPAESGRVHADAEATEQEAPGTVRLASARRRSRPGAIGNAPVAHIAAAPGLDWLQDESSPSDRSDVDQPGSATNSEKVAEGKQAGEPLTPLQDRQLEMSVSAVNVGEDGIGTGAIPTRYPFSETKLSLLPDGLARGAPFKTVHWRPTCMWHFPLYYEDAMLERHGHVRYGCFQSIVSGARFFGTMPLLPYKATLQPPKVGQYVLGHFRPGTPAPALRSRLPWDGRAAVVETLSLAGFFWGGPF